MASAPATSNVIAFRTAATPAGMADGHRLEQNASEIVIFPRTGVAEIRRLWAQFDADLDRAAEADPRRFPWRRIT